VGVFLRREPIKLELLLPLLEAHALQISLRGLCRNRLFDIGKAGVGGTHGQAFTIFHQLLVVSMLESVQIYFFVQVINSLLNLIHFVQLLLVFGHNKLIVLSWKSVYQALGKDSFVDVFVKLLVLHGVQELLRLFRRAALDKRIHHVVDHCSEGPEIKELTHNIIERPV